MLIDSHCHLDFASFAGRVPEVLARAEEAGVGRLVTIGTHVRRFETYRALADGDNRVFFTVGTHPHQAGEEPDVPASELVRLSRHPRCIAIGEAGLDYHYDRSPRDVQRRVFRTHIAAAREAGLPLVIHARDADDDMIAILEDEVRAGAFAAVLHCFSSGPALAQVGVALGFFVSFSGILTFRRSDELRRIAATVPRDRLLIETDAPFLAPEPHRGRPNEPAYVRHTAAQLGEALGLPLGDVATLTTDNFYRLFRKAAEVDLAPPVDAPSVAAR
jgi:TatD DNase family protein